MRGGTGDSVARLTTFAKAMVVHRGFSGGGSLALRPGFPGQTQQRAAEQAVEPPNPQAFEEQQRAGCGVEWGRRNGDLLLRFALRRETAAPMERPEQQQRKKQRLIRVGHPDDVEAGAAQEPAEAGSVIASQLVAENRVIPSQDLHGSDIDERESTRAQQAEHLSDGALLFSIRKCI